MPRTDKIQMTDMLAMNQKEISDMVDGMSTNQLRAVFNTLRSNSSTIPFGPSGLYRGDSSSLRAGTSQQYRGLRDIEEVCGYKRYLTFDDFFQTYDRQDIATRVVEVFPDYTWMNPPEVFETELGKATIFERQWNEHAKKLDIYSELRKFDVLSGIGQFGLLVIGVAGTGNLETPLTPVIGEEEEITNAKRRINYMRAYMEGEISISKWEQNRRSSRFAQPTLYEISPRELQVTNGANDSLVSMPLLEKKFNVHWTRVIHFADNAVNGNVFGVPRLRRIYNCLTDVLKIVAGSAEMFWRGAYQGYSFEMDAESIIDDAKKEDMKQQIKRFMMGLDRELLLQGVKTNQLSPAIASPKDHLDAQLTRVAIAADIPKRILCGSEMGKLASVQDAQNWSAKVGRRQRNIAEPLILRPYINFCIRNGIIRPPVGGIDSYRIHWPELERPTEIEISDKAVNLTQALSTYVEKDLYDVMDFATYLAVVWDFTTEKANEVARKFNVADFKKMKEEKEKAQHERDLSIKTAQPPMKKINSPEGKRV